MDRNEDRSADVTGVTYGISRLEGCWVWYRFWEGAMTENVSMVVWTAEDMERIRERVERQREGMRRVRKRMRRVRALMALREGRGES